MRGLRLRAVVLAMVAMPVDAVAGQLPAPGPAGSPGSVARPDTIGETGLLRRAGEDLAGGVAALATDGWDVVTSPFHASREELLVAAGVLAVGGALYAVDGDVQEVVRGNRDGRLQMAVRDVGEIFEPLGLMGNTNVVYLGGIATGWLAGWDPLLHASRDLLVSHWLASGTYQLPRRWIGRNRPEQGRGPRSFVGGTALPSGHSSTIVQVATVLSHHIDRAPATGLLWAMAGSVLFQRIDSEKHWASDVWLGAAWGYGVARLVLHNAERRRAPEAALPEGAVGAAAEGPGVRVTPWVPLGTGGVGVAVRVPFRGALPR